MAEKATIARPYAKAAFAHAQQQRELQRWSEALAVASAVVTDEQVQNLLGNPRVSSRELVDLIANIAGPKADATIRNFLSVLADARRLELLLEITAMFEVMRADVENVADVEIISAVELNDHQKARLAGALGKRLNRQIRLHCSVDPRLVGGAIVRSADLVIDGSLDARLKRLATELTA